MTEKLYYVSSHMTQCQAVVRACVPGEGGFSVLLDRTVLFPEGGGQPADRGVIGEANVLDCQERDGEVIHMVDKPLAVGSSVTVTLDWPRRFDFMQQHTGEHLLSFAFYRLFGAANVGFHLAESYTTIDFDKPLTPEQIAQAELLSNEFVWRNLPVTAAMYPDEEAIRDLPLRKHAEGLTAPIRIVQVEDADCCTCCAPHCERTGEVGQIFIYEAAAYKGGVRITFCCGKRALANARRTHQALDTIARRFSVSREQAQGAVGKLNDDFASARHREKALAAQLNGYMAQELAAETETAGKGRVIVHLYEGMEAGRLKDLAQTAAAPQTLAVIFSASEDKLSYVLAAGKGFPIDAGELIQAVNAAVGGKGGGRGSLAQGMAPNSAGARGAVAQLKHYFLQRLK